jgi:RNA polymerase sigma-70 factor (ECF subfamily)
MATDDARYLARAKAGDSAAFATLYARYERRIFAYLLRQLEGRRDDAADLTQLTFLKAYDALPKTDASLNLNAWLHRIAANAFIDLQRHRARFGWLPWSDRSFDRRGEDWLDDPEARAVFTETQREVGRVLRAMRPHHRQALILREYGGLSTEEIGARMGLTRAAVKSLLFRARAEFRSLYDEREAG